MKTNFKSNFQAFSEDHSENWATVPMQHLSVSVNKKLLISVAIHVSPEVPDLGLCKLEFMI